MLHYKYIMKPFATRRVLAFSWDRYQVHGFFLVLVLMFIWAISFGVQFIADAFMHDVSWILGLLIFLFGFLLSSMLSMGFIYIILRIIRKRKVSHEDILKPAPLVLNYIGATRLHGVIVLFGVLLLIIPGIIWSIRYGFYRYVMIDGCSDPLRALHVSWCITRGHTWQLFWFLMLMGLLNLLGLLAFGVGLFVTIPLTEIATARVYDRLLANSKINFSE